MAVKRKDNWHLLNFFLLSIQKCENSMNFSAKKKLTLPQHTVNVFWAKMNIFFINSRSLARLLSLFTESFIQMHNIPVNTLNTIHHHYLNLSLFIFILIIIIPEWNLLIFIIIIDGHHHHFLFIEKCHERMKWRSVKRNALS